MRNAIPFSLLIVAVLLPACEATPTPSELLPAIQAARSTSTINVTSVVYDADSAGNPLLTRSDDYNGTGSASYVATSGAQRITSGVDGSGTWMLYLGNQTTRTLYLVLASQGIVAPDGYYSANVEAYSKCFDQSTNQVNIRLMAVGESNGNCSFGVDFSSNGTKYKLAMSPNYAGTGRALVTCKAAAGGYCTSWTIMPNANVANAGVANLYHYGTRGALVFDGTYHNSYAVNATQ